MPETIITLIIPEDYETNTERHVVIRRGDLATTMTFRQVGTPDYLTIFQEADARLSALEAAPPPEITISEPTRAASAAKSTPDPRPAPPPKPQPWLLDVAGKKVKVAPEALAFTGDTPALELAARLIEARLWDGVTPIRIDPAALTEKIGDKTPKQIGLLYKLDALAERIVP
jgi:hypothetical protein